MVSERQKQINRLKQANGSFDDFDSQFDAMFNRIQKNSGKAVGVVIALWVLGVILSLALTGVVIWAIIYVVLALV